MLKKIFISLLLLVSSSSYLLGFTHYVNAQTLKVRIAPTSSAYHSYSIYKGHKVQVHEMKDGWARISKSKAAAKWVHGDYITPIKKEEKELVKKEIPPKEMEPIVTIEYNEYDLVLENVAKSENYEKFKPIFIATSKRLYDNGTCTLKDFKRSRGWMELADDVIYFIYCGNIKRSNKIYLNVITGKATK